MATNGRDLPAAPLRVICTGHAASQVQELLLELGSSAVQLASPSATPPTSRHVLLVAAGADPTGFVASVNAARQWPDVPLVVAAPRALLQGHADFLERSRIADTVAMEAITGELLHRVLEFAVERARLEDHLRAEVDGLAARVFAQSAPTRTTATVLGLLPLAQSAPDLFEGLRQEWQAQLHQAVTDRLFERVVEPNARAQNVVHGLAAVGAGARDVVDLHTEALRAELEGTRPDRAAPLMEEARILLVFLLGQLIEQYRFAPLQSAASSEPSSEVQP